MLTIRHLHGVTIVHVRRTSLSLLIFIVIIVFIIDSFARLTLVGVVSGLPLTLDIGEVAIEGSLGHTCIWHQFHGLQHDLVAAGAILVISRTVVSPVGCNSPSDTM